MTQKESAGKTATESVKEPASSGGITLWRIVRICVKYIWLITLHIWAFIFWLLAFMFIYSKINSTDPPRQAYPLVNGYSAVSRDSIIYFDIQKKSGYAAVRLADMVCIEGDFLHGRNNDHDPEDEGYFILDTKNGDLYKSPKYCSHEKALEEYLLVIADYGLRPCTEENSVEIPFLRNRIYPAAE